jgi:hypothetical protein
MGVPKRTHTKKSVDEFPVILLFVHSARKKTESTEKIHIFKKGNKKKIRTIKKTEREAAYAYEILPKNTHKRRNKRRRFGFVPYISKTRDC